MRNKDRFPAKILFQSNEINDRKLFFPNCCCFLRYACVTNIFFSKSLLYFRDSWHWLFAKFFRKVKNYRAYMRNVKNVKIDGNWRSKQMTYAFSRKKKEMEYRWREWTTVAKTKVRPRFLLYYSFHNNIFLIRRLSNEKNRRLQITRVFFYI